MKGIHQWPVDLSQKGNSNAKNVSIWWCHNDAGQHPNLLSQLHGMFTIDFFSPSVPEVKGNVISALYNLPLHYSNVIISVMVSQITSISIVHSTVCSGTDQRNHQSSATLTFVRGIHRWAVNSPHKGSVTRKMFPFDDVIMIWLLRCQLSYWWKQRGCFNLKMLSYQYRKTSFCGYQIIWD